MKIMIKIKGSFACKMFLLRSGEQLEYPVIPVCIKEGQMFWWSDLFYLYQMSLWGFLWPLKEAGELALAILKTGAAHICLFK